VHNWGDEVYENLTLAVLLVTATDIRMKRLAEREQAKFGSRIALSGDLHDNHVRFMNKAASYDEGEASTRSLRRDKMWLRTLACPTILLDGSGDVNDLVMALDYYLRELSRQ